VAVFTTRPEIRGTFGVAASTHWLASAVAMGVLERGGNAFDAAVAGGFVLQVVEPHLNGPGGEVPIIFATAASDEPRVLCGQGPAPLAASIEHFDSLGLDRVPGTGPLAAVVPGAFGAWITLLRDYGTLRLSEALAPAIHYARHGYPLVARISTAIESMREVFETEWTASAALYLPASAVPTAGALFRNPALADTWDRLIGATKGGSRAAELDSALKVFYQGFIAEALVAFNSRPALDTSGERHAGLLCRDDLAGWQPSYEEPVSLDYHDARVFKCGPWSQGPVFLQQLALLEGYDIGELDPNGAEFIHLVTECAKLAFADREAWYGDPDFVDVPLSELLDDSYSAARRALISPQASQVLRPGSPGGRRPRLADLDAFSAGITADGAGEPTTAAYPTRAELAARGATCHIDVIDRHGNMVAAPPSGGWLQSSPTVPELGFCLSTRAQMFWLQPGLPASLAPGKRPRTTLTPSLAYRDGRPYMAFGTPGGDQQDQWTLVFLLRHLHHGYHLQQAIDAPAFHTNHFPSSFYPRRAKPGELELEARFSAKVIDELSDRGHTIVLNDAWSLGRISAAARQPDGILKAAANPRGMQGYAVGR